METKEKLRVKKLKNLEDLKELRSGDRIVIKADKCRFSAQEMAVLQTGDNLKFINSYHPISGDLKVSLYTIGDILKIDEEGRLIVSSVTSHGYLDELLEEHKDALFKAGYEIPRWAA